MNPCPRKACNDGNLFQYVFSCRSEENLYLQVDGKKHKNNFCIAFQIEVSFGFLTLCGRKNGGQNQWIFNRSIILTILIPLSLKGALIFIIPSPSSSLSVLELLCYGEIFTLNILKDYVAFYAWNSFFQYQFITFGNLMLNNSRNFLKFMVFVQKIITKKKKVNEIYVWLIVSRSLNTSKISKERLRNNK